MKLVGTKQLGGGGILHSLKKKRNGIDCERGINMQDLEFIARCCSVVELVPSKQTLYYGSL